MNRLLHHTESLHAMAAGLLFVLAVPIVLELTTTMPHAIIALALVFAAFILAKKTGQHFHGHHHHDGDSVFDTVAIGVLFIANVLHPIIDGFTITETIGREGAIVGLLLAGAVALHEAVRQSALIIAFRGMSIKWYWVVLTAVLGIATGVFLGLVEAAHVGKYEFVADFAALFAYVFIIAEFRFSGHGTITPKARGLFGAGIAIGILVILLGGH